MTDISEGKVIPLSNEDKEFFKNAAAELELPERTEDGWFKNGNWKGKPALCRRVMVKICAAPVEIPFFWSNKLIGQWYPAIEIVTIRMVKKMCLVNGARIKQTKAVFGKPFFIDNENEIGQKLVLAQLTVEDIKHIEALPGTSGNVFRLVYTNEISVEGVE